jgi:mRNA interferase MazF
MKVSRGDIFWANLDPTIGSEISKTRPVLILSNDISNEFSSTVTILPITTFKKGTIYPFEIFLSSNESNLKEDSKIKANQIRTIDKTRLIDKTGALTSDKIKEVEKAVLLHLNIKF